MARRRGIDEVTSTAYFENVTPLWVPPNVAPIDTRYHNAILELAKWAGPNWVSNEETFFFPLRQKLIRICERWRDHDWPRDVRWINERREDSNNLASLDRAFGKFVSALKKAPFRQNKRALGIAFLAELCPDAHIDLNHEQGINAVERALDRFHQNLKIKDGARAQFGPIEYPCMPRQPPEREIAIALSLASSITIWRRDGLSEGNHISPHKPVISKNMPWKAIALFAWANSENADYEMDIKDIQKRVTSLARTVVAVDLMGKSLDSRMEAHIL
jgi:hypothetical protein